MHRYSSVVTLLLLLSCGATAEWNGGDYQKHNQPQAQWSKNYLDNIALRGDEQVLDLGCGDGSLTKKLALRLPKGSIVGLDLSESMIETAKTIVEEDLHERLSFVVGDAANFKLDKKFDLIVSFTALHWVKDHDKVFELAASHLNAGGKIHFVFPVKWDHFPQMLAAFDAALKSPKYAPFLQNHESKVHLQSIDDYFPRLARNGFKLETMMLRPKETVFESRDKMFGFIKGWVFGQFPTIPKEMRDEFVNDFIDTYIAQADAIDAEGNIHYYGYLMELVATRKDAMAF